MISITVPVFNEEDALMRLYEKIVQVVEEIGRPWELILIDDGSTDGSGEVMEKLAAKDDRVKVVRFRRNFGQTAAMMAGFDFARGEVIIPIDADLQNDPGDIPKMLAKLDEGYDVVSGWRKDRQDDALKRNLPSILANKVISFVSGVRLHDFGCSLKAYRRDFIKGVRLYGEMHRFLPIYARWHGARITEITVNHFPRTTGTSKYGFERVMKVIFDLIVVKFLDRHAQKPMYVFGGIGFLTLIVGFLSGLWAVYLRVFKGVSFIQTPLPTLVAICAITGIMCFLMGLLAEMISRTFYESQGKSVYLVGSTTNMDGPEP